MTDRLPHPPAPLLCLAVSLAVTFGATPAAAQPVTLELVAGGLERPVAVTGAGDGSGRLFIVEQEGRILVWRNGTVGVFLDIDALVAGGTSGERGLLGLAFHPDFAENGFFYVNYTRGAAPGRTVVARYRVSDADPDVADPASAHVLREFEQDASNHNGGDLHFGPDGYLYVASGDGGGAGDPLDRAQSLGTLLGKLLRIDVDGSPPPEPNGLCGLVQSYGVPADNPFAFGSSGCDEIWAYGLRNPWRFSFDRRTGDLWLGDVGQGEREEIDFQPAGSAGGENYGWSCREGDLVQSFNPCDGAPLVDPVLVYDHGLGCSVTGGYRYRGGVRELRGTYVYGDFCSGRIWRATPAPGGGWSSTPWMDTGLLLSSFGEDDAGELYAVDLGGGVYRFESRIFTDGFESGDVAAWSRAVP